MKRSFKQWFSGIGMATKISLGGGLVTIAAVGATGWLAYSGARELLSKEALEQLQESSEHQADRIAFALASIQSDALYLAESRSVQGLLNAQRKASPQAAVGDEFSGWNTRLSSSFGALNNSKGYLQVRLIDALSGRELCKTISDGASEVGYSVIAPEALQDKSGREYVQRGLRLKHRGMYVSPITLNREHGVVQVPQIRTQRFVTPVYSNPRGTQSEQSSQRSIRHLAMRIDVLDKALTNAASQAAESGELKWEASYLSDVEALDQALAAAVQLGGAQVRKALAVIDRANDALIEMEQRAFELVREQDSKQALALLNSIAYLENKAEYKAGMESMLAELAPELIGLVVINVDTSHIIGNLEASKLVQAWVLDENGRTLQSNCDIEMGHDLDELSPDNLFTGEDERDGLERLGNLKHSEVLFQGDRILVSAPIFMGSDIADSHLTLVLRQDVEALLAGARGLGTRILVIALLACCCVGLLGVILARRITRPLQGLTAKADLLASGEAHTVFFPGTDDSEVGRLATAFSNLVESLRASTSKAQASADSALRARDQVRSLNSELEGKVALRTEQLQEALLKAESANLAKSEFLATMSHEIRTPMNGVIGMTSILLDSELSSDQREYAEMVRGSGEALLSIINDILDFSKVEAGKLELERVEFDPVVVMEEALELVAAKAHAKGVELIADLDTELPRSLTGDPGRLRQVLINLLGNATKFTASGEIVLSALCRACEDGKHLIRFSVRDTGIGISAEAQERLFNKFSQAEESTSREFGGTGLGLAICRQLVELMEGEIDVISEPGQGSEFHFEASFECSEEALEPERKLFQSKRVLIVEKNPTAARVMRDLMCVRGFEVVSDGDPGMALAQLTEAYAAERPFDVVLLAASLLVAEQIRAAISEVGLPLILLLDASGSSRVGDDFERLNALRRVVRLSKPLRRASLDARLTMHLLDTGEPPMPGELALVTEQLKAANMRDAQGVGAGLQVLLVEDNRVNQMVAARMLEFYGCSVDIVGDGVECIEALRMASYQMVFMDCQMPVMNGFEATRVIRDELPGGDTLPIIAMTANAMQGDRERCLDAGMDEYISKPVRKEALRQVLIRFAQRKSA